VDHLKFRRVDFTDRISGTCVTPLIISTLAFCIVVLQMKDNWSSAIELLVVFLFLRRK